MQRISIAVCVLIAVLAVTAAADNYFLTLSGSGNLLDRKPEYVGTFLAGFTGEWSLTFEKHDWTGGSSSNGEFEYVWGRYFAENYDDTPGSEAWYGYFDGSTQGGPPSFKIRTTEPKGVLGGAAAVTIMVRDFNGDGLLSPSERDQNCQMTVTLAVDPELGKGVFRDMCGSGALGGGNFNFVDPPDMDEIMLVGNLNLEECSKGIEGAAGGR